MKKLSLMIIHTFIIYFFIYAYSVKGLTVDIEVPKEIKTIKIEIKTKKSIEEFFEDAKQARKDRIMSLAEEYTHKKGDCYKIAIKFIKELKGLNNIEKVDIYWWEAEPGDLIYYSNNGYGQTHWAVVLDLENDMALHGSGNWKRETVIRKIFEPNMARPKFYRLVERKNNYE